MPFNGAGIFNRLFNWQSDRDAGIDILAQRMDQEFDGVATGLSGCITRDGQSSITADIPFGGRRITGLGAPTGANDAARKADVDALLQPVVLDPITTNSGRTASWTSLPATATQFLLTLAGVRSNGTTDPFGLRLGTGGSDTTSGYLGAVSNITGAVTANHGTLFQLTGGAAGSSNIWHGIIGITLLDEDANQWAFQSMLSTSNSTGIHYASGSVSLSGVLDVITFRLGGSTDSFQAGRVGLRYS